jgi:hypothetical protein
MIERRSKNYLAADSSIIVRYALDSQFFLSLFTLLA